MEQKTTKVESENRAVITCAGMENLSLHVEPKIHIYEAIKFYYRGEKVGSASITVDLKKVPEELHGIAFAAVQCCMGYNFYLDGFSTESAKQQEPKEGWWSKVINKWKSRNSR